MKARYCIGSIWPGIFLSPLFFYSTLGNNPSYAWKGLWEAKRLLHRGCSWRIGNRQYAKVWEVPWIPGMQSVQAPRGIREEDIQHTKVASLIDHNTRLWNIQLINSLFNPWETAATFKIMLNQYPHDDKWIWNEEKCGGVFKMCSAYVLLQKEKQLVQGESSTFTTSKFFWKFLWKMKVTHKLELAFL